MDPSLSTLPTIGTRLGRLVTLVVGLSLAAMVGLGLYSEVQRFGASRLEMMRTTGRLFAAATSADLAAGRTEAVVQTLRAVARIPGLRRAEIRDKTGRVIAELGESAYLASDPRLTGDEEIPISALLRSDAVQVLVPVVHGGERIGQVRLLTETDELPAQLLALMVRDAAVGAAILALGLLLASRLRRSITAPLQELAATMAAPGRENAYDVVPETSGDRETRLLARAFNGMVAGIRQATQDILDREMEIITRLSRAAEQRDDQTGEHVVRVAEISRIIAEALGLPPHEISDLVRASPMHDVGKIAVPDAILFKPGRLDAHERLIMEQHASNGHDVLAGSKSALVSLAAEIALTHHERWDGKGYPRQLRGGEIPLAGRITAVADVCDALLSQRPYKTPWSLSRVRAFLEENAGSHFDPACVRALLDQWSRLEAIYASEQAKARAPARGARNRALDPMTPGP